MLQANAELLPGQQVTALCPIHTPGFSGQQHLVGSLQAEAAAAQRSFERSRALLESRLTQLSAAISSQERLICTLQVNESEARQAGALYLVRRKMAVQRFANNLKATHCNRTLETTVALTLTAIHNLHGCIYWQPGLTSTMCCNQTSSFRRPCDNTAGAVSGA